jgi:dTDP-4-dehydro-6-deoxy-alpha-D-gulose 4-ketoreductase
MTAERWAGRSVLVTGGLGFIGSHFAEHLLARGARVVCTHRRLRDGVGTAWGRTGDLRLIELDLRDPGSSAAAFAEAGPFDCVVHCAALGGNPSFQATHPALVLDENVRMTANVLECARRFDVPDTVLISSVSVYCAPPGELVTEDDDYHRYLSYAPNGYILSKLYGEMLAELSRSQYGMRVFVARPSNVYGPRDNLELSSTNVIPGMLHRLASGRTVEIWGDGSQTRSFLYVDDLVPATLAMVESGEFTTFNVGPAESTSIVELAHTLSDVLGVRPRLEFLADKQSGAAERCVDFGRVRQVTGLTPRSLRTGLAETVAWFRGRHTASRAQESQ